MSQIGIYSIVNKINKKIYIGSSSKLKKRFPDHKRELNLQVHRNPYLQLSWNKYGEENFEFSVIEYCEKSELIEREVYYISFYNNLNSKFGYNLAVPMKTASMEANESFRKKCSMAHKGITPKNINIIREKQRRPVDLFIDGIFQSSFESQTHAAKVLNLNNKGVNNYLCGRQKILGKNFKNFHLQYSDGKGVRQINYNPNSNWRAKL